MNFLRYNHSPEILSVFAVTVGNILKDTHEILSICVLCASLIYTFLNIKDKIKNK